MRASLKRAIGKLCSGTGDKERTGTAFLVTREHLFTALHVVADRQHVADGDDSAFTTRLQFTFEGEAAPCEVEVMPGLYDPYDDWAILRLYAPRDDIAPIPLGLLCDGLKTGVEAFGYPAEHGSLTVAGRVRDARASYHGSPALQIYSEEAAAGIGSPLNGLSGAPCLVGGLAVGIVRAHPVCRDALSAQPLVTVRNGTLYACPIDLAATGLPQLLANARRLDVESVERALAAEAHINCFQRYERALRQFALNNTYGLGSMRRDSLDAFPLLNGTSGNREPAAAVKLIAAVLADSSMAVLEGDAGSGKSSTLLAFAAQAWSYPSKLGLESPLLPMFVRLRDIVGASGASASERLAAAIGRLPAFAMEGAGLSAQFLLAWPETMEAAPVLLLDALDEVPDQHRLEVMQWLGTVREQVPRLRLVVSTRSLDLLRGSCFEAAPRVRLRAPTHELAVRIAAAYLAQGPSDLVEKLETAGLTDITSTPLATALAATVYAERGVLPTHRAALYKDYSDVVLKKAFPTGQVGGTGFSSGQAKHFLELIAWSATCADTDAQEPLMQALADGVAVAGNTTSMRVARLRADEVFQQLTEHSGVLAEKGEWRHETFREYFAAQYLAGELEAGRLQLPEVMGRHTQARWRGTLLFLFNIWSFRAKSFPEQQLAIYLPVFDALIGAEEGRVGRWLNSMRRSLGLPVAVVPAPTEESLAFAAEAVVELGRAPQRVEERILELLIAHDRAIGDTFKNLCELVFSDKGQSARRALGRWADEPRLSARLAPWVAQWLLDLQGECKDAAGIAGLVLLCHGEMQIEKLLDSDALPPDACAKLVRVCSVEHNPRWKLLGVKAVDSLLRRVKADQASSLANTDKGLDLLGAIENLQWLDGRTVDRNKFLRRVVALKKVREGFAERVEHPEIAQQFLREKWQSLPEDDRTELATAVPGMLSGMSDLDVVLESMDNDPVDVFESAVPQPWRAYARWYFDQPKGKRGSAYVACLQRAFQQTLEAFEEAAKDMEIDELFECLSSDSMTPLIAARMAQVIAQRNDAQDKAEEYVGRLSGPQDVRLAMLEIFANAAMAPARVALVAIYSQELAGKPGDTILLRKRAAQLDELQDWSAFEQDLSALLKADGNDAAVHLDRARAMLYLGRLQEAFDDATLVNQLNPSSEFAHFIRGLALQGLRRHRDALQAFYNVESLDTQASLFRSRTDSLYALGLVEDALRQVEEALLKDPDDGDLIERQAMILSVLGRNAESDERIAEWKDAPSGLGFWGFARLQNALIAGRQEEFAAIAEELEGTDRAGGWVRLLRLCMAVRTPGWLSASDAETARQAISECGDPSDLVLFFLLIGDNGAACAQLDSLVITKNESELRWVIVCAKGLLALLLPPSAEAVVAYAQSALERVETEVVAQAAPDSEPSPNPLSEPITEPVQDAAQIAPVKREKYLFANGMMCNLQGIWGFEEEKDICDNILRRYRGQPAMVMMPLLDTGHVYIQTNVRAVPGAEYDFKMSAEFAKLRDYGVLTKLMQEHRFSKVVVTDRALHEQISQAPTLGRLKKCMVLELHALPYTADLVTWEMRN